MPDTNGLTRWKTILGLAVLALTLLGMTLAGGRAVATSLWGLATDADIDAIENAHDADIDVLTQKIDCVIYILADVPGSCSDQAMPR